MAQLKNKVLQQGEGMEKIVVLLDERNRYLTKFSSLNEAELLRMSKGDFDHIDDFYQARENILEVVKHIEKLINDQIRFGTTMNITPISMRKCVQGALKNRDVLVTTILSQDLEIISAIEEAKSKIILELKTLRYGKKVVSAYKSYSNLSLVDEEY